MTTRPARNPLRPHAKLTLIETVQAVDLFAYGVGINTAARLTTKSRKTMRALYLDFRDRLSDPLFARWHRANAMLINVTGAEEIALIKATMLDMLAECHDQDTCYRNFRAGRRKTSICRSCPLHGKFSSVERDEEAAALINALRGFYHDLNIYAEDGRDPVVLLRLRLIHMVTIAAILQNSRLMSRNRLDPKDKGFLSFGTFREVMITHLIDTPRTGSGDDDF